MDDIDPSLAAAKSLAAEGRLAEAASALGPLLDRRPDAYAARLALGFIEQRRGRPLAAMAHLQWALRQARQRGRWLDPDSTEPELREQVGAASAFVTHYPLDYVYAALKEAGSGDFYRVEMFIRAQLGRERLQPKDPRQAPKKHFFPGLPASPWLDTALFPWAHELEAAFPAILKEYLAVAAPAQGFEPFLTFKSAEQVSRYLGSTGPAPEWNAFFFYRHGVRNDENCRRCPRTAALVDSLPLIRIPGFTPEICFSVLTPGSHILPHRGDSNLRSVVHLGLVVPPDCALNVAGDARSWQPGHVWAFEDTYEHEAWNRSSATRAVLLMDAWNPHLTADEKRALPRVVEALGQLGAELERTRPKEA